MRWKSHNPWCWGYRILKPLSAFRDRVASALRCIVYSQDGNVALIPVILAGLATVDHVVP